MSFLEGWKLGEDIDNNQRREERQAREDKWANEERAQKRGLWERETQAREGANAYMDAGLKDYENAPAGVDPAFLKLHGLESQAPQSAYGLRQGFEPNMQTPQMAAPNPARQRAVDDMKYGRTVGGMEGLNTYRNARKQVDDSDMGSRHAQLHAAVLAAPPEKVAAFAKTYSDNSTAPGKLVQGKNGLMTLTLDGGEVIPMSRTQVASYVTGLYKMQQGDQTGLADIAGVNEKLAAATQHLWTKQKDVVSSNNDAVAKSNSMANDNQRTANSNASLGLSKERARAAADAEKMGLVRQYQDPKTGEVKEMYPVTTKSGGITWEEVPTPAGMRPYSLSGKSGGTAPMSKVEEAGTTYRDNRTGGIKIADGRGGFVAEDGVMPGDRAGALGKAKLPDNLIGQLPWNADGTAVGFAGKAYKVNDPADMRALRQDYERLSRSSIEVEEAQKVDNHYMNNPAKTFGRSGSIYDTPEQRAAHTRAYDAQN